MSIHPDDAVELGVSDNQLIRLESAQGYGLARAQISDSVARGQVFLPMHWNDRFSGNCVPGRLVGADRDAISGQPELKHTPVAVTPVAVGWSGFLIARDIIVPRDIFYWTRVSIAGGHLYELAGPESPDAMVQALTHLAGATPKDEIIDYRDAARGVLRIAVLRQSVLRSCLFAGTAGSLPSRNGLLEIFASARPLEAPLRLSLLSGRAPSATPSAGRTVCACFNVGLEAIKTAIRDHALTDAWALGRYLRAGTNCGSCVSELKDLIRREASAITP